MTDISEASALRERVRALMPRAKSDLAELVSYRSVYDPRVFPIEECRRAARWTRDAFADVGLAEAELYETSDGSEVVVARHPAPAGAPTVLLYCHYDVQPPMDEGAWISPAWELTERDGRWYGRGAADCKGNLVAHLTALRALRETLGDKEFPVGITLVAEGSEEQGTGGMETFVPAHAELLRSDALVIGDCGNFALGLPTLTQTLRGMVSVVLTVETLAGPLHSGMFGGAAPDALAALIHLLASMRDEHGNTTIAGLPADQRWTGEQYPADRFRVDAGVLDGVELLGDGTVADMIWARPALTVIGIDVPPVVGSAAAIQPTARARLNLRIPPGIEPEQALKALTAHVDSHIGRSARVTLETEGLAAPFRATTGGPARRAMEAAFHTAFGRASTTQGQGGSIPLCNTFAETYPDAEIMLLGVEEPKCLIHAPNESVDPAELERIALTEALFLLNYAR
ncbi:M20/M25/M40 family metallo-hydrolase [Nocardia sp. NPDC003482]